MKTKVLSILLILVLLFTAAGCGGGETNEDVGTNDVAMEFVTYKIDGNKLAVGYKLSGDVTEEQTITVKAVGSNGSVETFKFKAQPTEEKQIASFELANTTGEITMEFSAKSGVDTENNATLELNNKRMQLTKDSVKLVAASLTESEMAQLLVGYFGPSEDKVVLGSCPLNAIERFGIPAFVMADATAGVRIFPAYTTWYPSASAVASTWNVDIASMVGEAIGNEAKVMGVDAILGPGMTLNRSVFGARVSEYYSEDPFLSGHMAAAYVTGMQSTGTYSCLKHYAANNQDTDRTNMSANVSERVLREVYLKNFGYAFKSDPKMFMTSYNKINGVHTSNFADLIRVAREEFGFSGAITTDWTTNADVIQNVICGNDMTNPGSRADYDTIVAALTDGTIPRETAIECIERILTLIASSNSMGDYRTNTIDEEKGAEVALKAGEESIVLLKNDGNALPFASGEVALFGVGSYTTVKGQQGSGWVNSKNNVNIVDAFADEEGPFTVNKSISELYKGVTHWDSMPAEPTIEDAKITKSANDADIAIITISRLAAEGTDIKNEKGQFLLSDAESSIIDRVSKAYHAKGKKVVVVLNVCNPVEVMSWRSKVDAILYAPPGGKMIGYCVMNVISGKVNPSGKLSNTWPVEYGDEACANTFAQKGNSDYNEGIYVGYRNNVSNNVRYAYEFGYGLSYTTFSYSNIKLSKEEFSSVDDTITAEVTVTNTGDVAGMEVVEFYLTKPETLVEQVDRELIGFDKTNLLAPGESETITITLTSYELESFIESSKSWVVSHCDYIVSAAASCMDVKSNAMFKVQNDITTSTVTTDLSGNK